MKRLNYTIKYLFLFTLLVIFSFTANAQTVIHSAGDWGKPSIWALGNIADDITEDVIIMNNRGTITVSNDYTTGNILLNDKNTLTINANHSLSVGESGTPKDFITKNTADLNVDGDLTIWGDLTVNNNLGLNVTGNLIIKGNADLKNTAIVNVSGTMIVDGNFTASNNLDFIVDGEVTIDGDFTAGNGATTSGSGTAIIGGTCTSGICNTGPLAAALPIELYLYEVKLENNNVRIDWSTASELNNDYFVVERSDDAYHFEEIGRETGAGNSDAFRYYAVTDRFPFEGVSYYRLKQVDFDGKTTYFDIKMVDNKNGYVDKHGLTVFPNPIMEHGKFNIGLEGFDGDIVKVEIQNMNGFLIYSNEINISQDRELIELSADLVSDSGMYVLSVFSDSKWYHHKFLNIK